MRIVCFSVWSPLKWNATSDTTTTLAFEHAAMLAAVNNERQVLAKTPVTLPDVEEAERAALGHVDYPEQFAISCAALVRRG